MPPVYLELDQIITNASLVEKAQQISLVAPVAQEEQIRREMPKISEERSNKVEETKETSKIYVNESSKREGRGEREERKKKKKGVDIKV